MKPHVCVAIGLFFTAVAFYLAFQDVNAAGLDNCEAAADYTIQHDGALSEADRPKVIKRCEAYQQVLKNPVEKGAYVLLDREFVCTNIDDYKHVYNWIIDNGGVYEPAQIHGYESCSVVDRSRIAVAIEAKGKLVWVWYHDASSVYVLRGGWVLGSFLVEYADHQGKKL